MDNSVLEKVITASGGAAELARHLNISRSAIAQWQQVPVNRVLDVERITGISRHDLRPDIYGQRSDGVAA